MIARQAVDDSALLSDAPWTNAPWTSSPHVSTGRCTTADAPTPHRNHQPNRDEPSFLPTRPKTSSL
jgi:hypothetical protein